MVKLVIADVEADGLEPTKIHFIRVKTNDGFKFTFFDINVFATWVKAYKPQKWVFHNGLGYDCWVVNRLVEPGLIDPMSVIDTMVVSKLVNYQKFNTHSLKELGEFLGVYKGEYNGPWDVCTPEMITYGEQDVEVLEAILDHYWKYIIDPKWAKAMRTEHDAAIIAYDMNRNGFSFDTKAALELQESIDKEIKEIEDSFVSSFPPKLEEVNRLKYRTKKDGSLFSTVEEAMSKYPLTKVEGDELICFDYVPFNPGSPKDRIDILWEAGWKPTDMTDGHKKFRKENK